MCQNMALLSVEIRSGFILQHSDHVVVLVPELIQQFVYFPLYHFLFMQVEKYGNCFFKDHDYQDR